jgi:6-phosphogluconate dehydrogenase
VITLINTATPTEDIGVNGLGVMGENLALNIGEFNVAAATGVHS